MKIYQEISRSLHKYMIIYKHIYISWSSNNIFKKESPVLPETQTFRYFKMGDVFKYKVSITTDSFI